MNDTVGFLFENNLNHWFACVDCDRAYPPEQDFEVQTRPTTETPILIKQKDEFYQARCEHCNMRLF